MVADLDESGAAEVAREVGGDPLVLDVSDPDAWSEITSRGPTIAVLNAGMTSGWTDLATFSDEHYRRIRSVNLDGVVWGIRAVLPAMRAAGQGAIVVTASAAGLIPHSGDPFYTATKHALVGLVRASAPLLASDAVSLSCICPGLVDTPLSAATIAARKRSGTEFDLISADEIAVTIVELVTGKRAGPVLLQRGGGVIFDAEPPLLR